MSDQKKPITLPGDAPVDTAFEIMLKKFLKQVQKDGVLEEVKKRQYYIKPNERRRMKEKEKGKKK